MTAQDSSLQAGAPNEEAAPVEVVSTLTRLIILRMSNSSHLNVLRGERMKGVRCENDVYYFDNDGRY